MKAPACDPGDFYVALGAESTLLIPEIAKSAGTPKRFQHVSPFAFFEVGFIGWIVRVRFAFNLDVSFDGSALGVVQPDFSRPSFVIAGFTEEGPVTIPASVKVFRFEPARAFVRVPSSCPLPQTREDVAIHVFSSLACPKFLGPHRGLPCHCFPSLVERRELCRCRSGSANIAGLAPCPICLPSLPARYVLGVGERSG